VRAPRLRFPEAAFVDTVVVLEEEVAFVFVDLAAVFEACDLPLAETCAVPDDLRFKLLDGVAVASTPEPTTRPRRITPMILTSFDTRQPLF
jgi:hypothetical protein